MFLRTALLAAPLLLPFAALGQAPNTPAPATPATPDANPLLARVDGEEVRLSDVAAAAAEVLPPELRGMPPVQLLQMLPPEVSRQLVDRAITERALVLAARREGLDRDEAVARRIRRAEEGELQQALLSRAVAGAVTEEALRARYEQEIARRGGEEEVHARHILLPSEAAAREALAEVQRAGADFAAIAGRRSTEPGARDRGGDLGFFKRGDMVPEFATAAFALQPGQVSPQPVRSPFGWHVIKVEERRQSAVPSFEDSRQALREELLQAAVDETVRRVRDGARIERFDGVQAAPATPSRTLLDTAAPPEPERPAGRQPAGPTRR